jgi:hypothetical protein
MINNPIDAQYHNTSYFKVIFNNIQRYAMGYIASVNLHENKLNNYPNNEVKTCFHYFFDVLLFSLCNDISSSIELFLK